MKCVKIDCTWLPSHVICIGICYILFKDLLPFDAISCHMHWNMLHHLIVDCGEELACWSDSFGKWAALQKNKKHLPSNMLPLIVDWRSCTPT